MCVLPPRPPADPPAWRARHALAASSPPPRRLPSEAPRCNDPLAPMQTKHAEDERGVDTPVPAVFEAVRCPAASGGSEGHARSPVLLRHCPHRADTAPRKWSDSTRALPPLQAHNKHDIVAYTLTNASLIGLAGLVTGAQEAYLTFEVREGLRRGHDNRRMCCIFGLAVVAVAVQ